MLLIRENICPLQMIDVVDQREYLPFTSVVVIVITIIIIIIIVRRLCQ